MSKLAPYYKAIAGALAPAVGLFVKDYVTNGGLPTVSQWVGILVAAVVGGVGVYAAPKNRPVVHRRRNQRGESLVGLLIAVVVIILIVWLVLALVGHR